MIGRKSLWAGIVGMTLTIGGVAVAANAGGEEEAPVEAAAPVTETIAEIDSFEVPDQGRDVEGEFLDCALAALFPGLRRLHGGRHAVRRCNATTAGGYGAGSGINCTAYWDSAGYVSDHPVPEQVAALVSRHDEISRARVIASREGEMDVMTVQIEADGGEPESYANALADTLKLKGRIEIVAKGSLPNDGKVIEDQRTAYRSLVSH